MIYQVTYIRNENQIVTKCGLDWLKQLMQDPTIQLLTWKVEF